jgi:threonine dehydrogenase-like Zn-dependent dehydrogenase
MRGAILHAPGDVRCEERPDPTIIGPTDAIVPTVATCVAAQICGHTGASIRSASPGRSVMNIAASWSRPAMPWPLFSRDSS